MDLLKYRRYIKNATPSLSNRFPFEVQTGEKHVKKRLIGRPQEALLCAKA
ncbi:MULTISPECIES: hypothetical protein [unclassified Lysinibacillus]|nr:MULTISPECIES: hypothetical protein [unclassified Lysinibacillus]MDM5250941.1 hypothetical protein [Lysinibacillus sp. G4S2]